MIILWIIFSIFGPIHHIFRSIEPLFWTKVQRKQGMMDTTYWTRNRVKIKTQNMADLKKLMI